MKHRIPVIRDAALYAVRCYALSGDAVNTGDYRPGRDELRLAQVIGMARESLDLTPAQAAEKIGCTEAELNAWEHAAAPLPESVDPRWTKLVEVLGL